MGKGQKLPVTMRALVQRLNRRLRAEQRAVQAVRPPHRKELGDFILVDRERKSITPRVNPVTLGRELDVLKPWEQVEGDK